MKTKNLLKITVGMLIICIFLLGMMIPMSATSEAEEIQSETTLIEENGGARATSSVVSLSQSSLTMVEGNTATLTATTQPSGLSVTWSTSNSSVATVNSSGRVTAIKAGQTSVIATVTSNGTTYRAYCNVYICVPNGVYYIKNCNSNYYLNVLNGKALNSTNVQQYSKYASTAADTYLTRQMWKINYLGLGAYSVRPLHKLDMGLEVNGSNVDIYKIGTTDTINAVPSEAQWTIEWDSNGYVFKYDGHDSFTMQVENASTSVGANVITSDYSSSRTCAKWTFEAVSSAPEGAFLYDATSGSPVSTSTEYVAPEETRTLSAFKLDPAFYSGETIDQSFFWYSSNSNVATVDDSTGAVTGVVPGTVTITGRKDLNGYFYYVRYTVIVTEVANGTYFLQNKQTGCYADIQGPVMANGTTIQQWEFHGGDWQKWIFTHVGDGYYSIKSKNSTTPYYLGVKNDYGTLDADIVLRSGSLTNGMKWAIEKTTSGAYKLIPIVGLVQDYVLATSTSNTGNGFKLIQGDYVENNSYRDEWSLFQVKYTYYVNHYYDQGFGVRFASINSDSEELITSYQNIVAERFLRLYNIQIIPTYNSYTSSGDTCKILSYGGVMLSNCSTNCNHSSTHLTSTVLRNDLNDGTTTGSVVIWTGHILKDNSRSNSSSTRHSIVITPWLSSTLSDASDINRENIFDLAHEQSHQLGAPDHYCYGIGNTGKCSNSYCDICFNGRIEARNCFMSYRYDLATLDDQDMYCSDCIITIKNHVNNHH